MATTLTADERLPHLTGHHRHTYAALLRHPTAHNLEWHDVRSLLEAIATVSEGENGALEVTRNGQSLWLHTPKHKDTPAEVVQDIRRFLESSGFELDFAASTSGTDLLVVIDHHEAKVYSCDTHNATPQKLVPYDPHGYGRHLHSAHEWTDGKRQPERKSYYDAVAKAIGSAGRIVVFGAGTGRSNAMLQLMADLSAHHPHVAEKVIASEVVDIHHTTGDQLLAEARTVFARFNKQTSPSAKGSS